MGQPKPSNPTRRLVLRKSLTITMDVAAEAVDAETVTTDLDADIELDTVDDAGSDAGSDADADADADAARPEEAEPVSHRLRLFGVPEDDEGLDSTDVVGDEVTLTATASAAARFDPLPSHQAMRHESREFFSREDRILAEAGIPTLLDTSTVSHSRFLFVRRMAFLFTLTSAIAACVVLFDRFDTPQEDVNLIDVPLFTDASEYLQTHAEKRFGGEQTRSAQPTNIAPQVARPGLIASLRSPERVSPIADSTETQASVDASVALETSSMTQGDKDLIAPAPVPSYLVGDDLLVEDSLSAPSMDVALHPFESSAGKTDVAPLVTTAADRSAPSLAFAEKDPTDRPLSIGELAKINDAELAQRAEQPVVDELPGKLDASNDSPRMLVADTDASGDDAIGEELPDLARANPPRIESREFGAESSSELSAANLKRVEAAIQEALHTYDRSLELSQNADFTAARVALQGSLLNVASALDQEVAVGHRELYQIALIALTEVQDFGLAEQYNSERATSENSKIKTWNVVAQHKTPVLLDREIADWSWSRLTNEYLKFAEQQLVAAFRQTPDMSLLVYQYGCLQSARKDLGSNHLRRSETLLQAAVAIDPDNHLASSSLGMLKAERGEMELAKELLTSSLAVKEDAQTRSILD